MTIQKAIQKAVEGGYNDGWKVSQLVEAVLLDPSFWQALGKSMGWSSLICYRCNLEMPQGAMIDGHIFEKQGTCECKENVYFKPWLYYWHRLIDHLAEGKTIESYFTNL